MESDVKGNAIKKREIHKKIYPNSNAYTLEQDFGKLSTGLKINFEVWFQFVI